MHERLGGHCLAAILAMFAMGVGTMRPLLARQDPAPRSSEPWDEAEALPPADLVSLLGDTASPPAIVYVGFKPLYRPGHIPGAPLHGPTADPQGLEDLRHWAERISRSRMLVIYCGCCPLDKCPNVRPAFTLLKTMGFTNLHVLRLPTSFAADWVEKGYPIEATK
jgi:thiosulfate/3-mercaptopyruvate sulfurtransferase